jgi:hypothetical protein
MDRYFGDLEKLGKVVNCRSPKRAAHKKLVCEELDLCTEEDFGIAEGTAEGLSPIHTLSSVAGHATSVRPMWGQRAAVTIDLLRRLP